MRSRDDLCVVRAGARPPREGWLEEPLLVAVCVRVWFVRIFVFCLMASVVFVVVVRMLVLTLAQKFLHLFGPAGTIEVFQSNI